jgi:hypothetical protein
LFSQLTRCYRATQHAVTRWRSRKLPYALGTL